MSKEKPVKEKIVKPKLKQSETVVIKRSVIHEAAYNPRKKNPKVVAALKANFKKVGFLGGICWNKTTGNLIGGHKRLEAMDLIFNYNGSKEKDYDIKVEQIELDLKTEKEQNIFLNNKNVQGENDFELLAELLPEIDFEAAGLTDYDIQLVESIVPDFEFGKNDEIKEEIKELKEKSHKTKEQVRADKAKIKGDITEKQQSFHFTVTFDSYTDKAEFLEGIGINGDDIFITSKQFIKAISKQL
jgi:hypothetical protein